jgi:hypothetical protein
VKTELVGILVREIQSPLLLCRHRYESKQVKEITGSSSLSFVSAPSVWIARIAALLHRQKADWISSFDDDTNTKITQYDAFQSSK